MSNSQPLAGRAHCIVALGLFIASVNVASAQSLSCPHPVLPTRPPLVADRENQETQIDFRFVDMSRDDVWFFTEGVSLQRADQRLNAAAVTVYHEENRVLAQGPVTYLDHALMLDAADATLALDTNSAQLNAVTYQLFDGQGRGDAEQVTTAGERTELQRVIYTACPQGLDDWVLRANRMTLDHAKGRGRAEGMSLRFKDVPLFYLPYAIFPLDDRRQSGFLYPGIGHADDDGLDLAIPYYWNIAPNQDATIGPRWVQERGLMLQGEYRYLTQQSAGELRLEYMPDDDRLDTHRSFAELISHTQLAPRWRLDVDLKHVSDDRFFEDFGSSLTANSRSFLRSVAQLNTRGRRWHAYLLADDYESIDDTLNAASEPFRRLPRFGFTTDRPLGARGLRFAADAEAVHFDHDNDATTTGSRVDLYPRLSWPIYRSAGYLLPELGVRYTAYDLDRTVSDSPSRTTAIASFEGGLVFERNRSQDGWLQTLEPRFHYLYVPFEAQGDLPVFDTRNLTFNFAQLFRSNRFSGADRQGDANQVTLALTSRLYTPNGREIFDANIGTIVFFRDQRVQLPGIDEQRADTSPLVAEFNYRPSQHWRFRTGLQYDFEDDETDQALFGIQYRGQGEKLFNLSYRKRIDSVRQADLSFLFPVAERWQLIGRANYSFQDDTLLEGLFGFEYDSCCWAFRLFGRRFVHNLEGEKRNGLYFELELKGLGSLGRNTARVLERAILGYQEDLRN